MVNDDVFYVSAIVSWCAQVTAGDRVWCIKMRTSGDFRRFLTSAKGVWPPSGTFVSMLGFKPDYRALSMGETCTGAWCEYDTLVLVLRVGAVLGLATKVLY